MSLVHVEQKMDQQTWLSTKRCLNKSISLNSVAEISVKGNAEEKLPYEKDAALEEIIENLHEQVACLLCECNAKDKLVAEHAKTAQEANTGRERAEAEAAIQKQELEDMSQQKAAALKNCRQQLSSLKLEQDRRVNLERAYKILESKYTEARKKLANLTIENARLTKALVKKEEIIKNVSKQMSEATAEFNSLVSRLNSTERGNNVLKYEYRVLEREFKMKNRRADAENRQHEESAKRVAKLEAERQKLRLLVRKRIPGHAKTKPSNVPKAVDRRMSLMINRLCELEEENMTLKESACHNETEIRLLKAELAQMRCEKELNEAKVLASEKKIVSLKTELECLKESKRTTEDHFENLRLINVDLDHKLFAAKLQIKEAIQNVSLLEMELEDRSHYCEGLEATCLDLQLQLHIASVSVKDEVTEDPEEERKVLQTGLEITAELTNDTKLIQHSSLRDHMAAEDGVEKRDLLNSPMIEEIITTTQTEEPFVPCYHTCNTLYEVKNVVPRALPIVPSKKKRGKGTDLLRRLLFRRKRGGKKKKKLFALLHMMQI